MAAYAPHITAYGRRHAGRHDFNFLLLARRHDGIIIIGDITPFNDRRQQAFLRPPWHEIARLTSHRSPRPEGGIVGHRHDAPQIGI